MNSTAPRIRDWTWPLPEPSMKNQTKRAQITNEASPTTAAAVMNTLSGSYNA